MSISEVFSPYLRLPAAVLEAKKIFFLNCILFTSNFYFPSPYISTDVSIDSQNKTHAACYAEVRGCLLLSKI